MSSKTILKIIIPCILLCFIAVYVLGNYRKKANEGNAEMYDYDIDKSTIEYISYDSGPEDYTGLDEISPDDPDYDYYAKRDGEILNKRDWALEDYMKENGNIVEGGKYFDFYDIGIKADNVTLYSNLEDVPNYDGSEIDKSRADYWCYAEYQVHNNTDEITEFLVGQYLEQIKVADNEEDIADLCSDKILTGLREGEELHGRVLLQPYEERTFTATYKIDSILYPEEIKALDNIGIYLKIPCVQWDSDENGKKNLRENKDELYIRMNISDWK